MQVNRRAPSLEQIGHVTVYSLRPLKEKRRGESLDDRALRAWETMLLVRPYAPQRAINWEK